VPHQLLELPIGLQATDRFIDALHTMAGVKVPDSITDQRGRLLDMIVDMHQYLSGKRVALFGDPDQLVSLTEFLILLDMKPVYMVTGTPSTGVEKRLKHVLGPLAAEAKIAKGPQADMYLLHQWIKQEGVDLLIGNTYGKYIARDENIPYVRHGFPIIDRVGHQYFPTVGYLGAMRLVEQILGVFMEAPEEKFELVM
jgi:nitrogenase molybdenum-iron protein beta chain